MTTKAGISFSPLTKRIYWGKVNQKTGVAVGEQKDITSDFLQAMELKFPINTKQTITVDGKAKYRVIVVDMEKEVVINGKPVSDETSS